MKKQNRIIVSALLIVLIMATSCSAFIGCGNSSNPASQVKQTEDTDNSNSETQNADQDNENEPGSTNANTDSTEFQRFGYLDVPNGDWNWANYDQVFDGTYTHLILSALLPMPGGTLIPVDSMIDFNQDFIEQAQAAGTYVLFSIGASVVPYSTFISIANSTSARELFINNLISTLQSKGFDGIDLNIEGWYDGLSDGDVTAVNGLAEEIAQTIKALDPNYIVTVTLPASYWMPYSFTCSFINSDLVDYAHHMSYDFFYGTTSSPNGPWRAPGETIWIPGGDVIERSVYGSLKYLQDNGCEMNKVTAGIPFFSTHTKLWNETRDLKDWETISLHPDYLEKLAGTEPTYHWINDQEAISAKIGAYRNFGLGGVMVWQAGQEGSTGDLSEALFEASTK